MAQGLLVGDISARSGLGRKALRLYEARGILPSPHRTPSGYRVYPSETLALLAFVTRARRLGLTLAEIGHIVGLRRAGSAPWVHVRALIERKAADLTALLGELHRVLASWRALGNAPAAVCPHIEGKGGDVTWKDSLSRSAPHA